MAGCGGRAAAFTTIALVLWAAFFISAVLASHWMEIYDDDIQDGCKRDQAGGDAISTSLDGIAANATQAAVDSIAGNIYSRWFADNLDYVFKHVRVFVWIQWFGVGLWTIAYVVLFILVLVKQDFFGKHPKWVMALAAWIPAAIVLLGFFNSTIAIAPSMLITQDEFQLSYTQGACIVNPEKPGDNTSARHALKYNILNAAFILHYVAFLGFVLFAVIAHVFVKPKNGNGTGLQKTINQSAKVMTNLIQNMQSTRDNLARASARDEEMATATDPLLNRGGGGRQSGRAPRGYRGGPMPM